MCGKKCEQLRESKMKRAEPPAQPRVTSTMRTPQPVINVQVPPQKVEVTATIEKDENKVGGEVDKFELGKLRFQPDAVEENPAKLQKWITRMKIAVSGVGGDLAESMVDQCLVAAQVYQLQYRSLPEDEREDVEIPLAELTRGQHRCHERYVKPILERLPDDVMLEAEDRGRERDGGKPRLEDIFAILYRDMDVKLHVGSAHPIVHGRGADDHAEERCSVQLPHRLP